MATVTGPTPGSASSSSGVAWFRSTGPLRGRVPRSKLRAGQRDWHPRAAGRPATAPGSGRHRQHERPGSARPSPGRYRSVGHSHRPRQSRRPPGHPPPVVDAGPDDRARDLHHDLGGRVGGARIRGESGRSRDPAAGRLPRHRHRRQRRCRCRRRARSSGLLPPAALTPTNADPPGPVRTTRGRPRDDRQGADRQPKPRRPESGTGRPAPRRVPGHPGLRGRARATWSDPQGLSPAGSRAGITSTAAGALPNRSGCPRTLATPAYLRLIWRRPSQSPSRSATCSPRMVR